jgi:sulfane dehydrogenase subunit SoxC
MNSEEVKNLPHKAEPVQTNRRKFLLGGAAVAAGVLVKNSLFGMVQTSVSEKETARISVDPTKTPGPPPGVLGTRSPFEQSRLLPIPTSSRSPLHDFHGMITPSDLHFQRHHGGVPAIDPERFELLIHGMVKKPMVFTLKDLKRFPSLSRIFFIECSGNYRGGKPNLSPQEVAGLTSQSEWTGVMLKTLFREVGVDPRAKWFLAEGSDAAVMTRSVPLDRAVQEGMIAYGQNGEALRPEQGYPARLLIPGWEGNISVKWLRRIEFSDQPFHTREETSKYTEQVGNKIRQFSLDIDARSIITYPSFPQQVEKGWIEIKGIAWSGRGRVAEVHVSTDGGKKWHLAELQGPVLDKAHVRFTYLWYWDGKETEIRSRTTDETGYIQPTLKQLQEARGGRSGYHSNPVTGWVLRPDGTVHFNDNF